MKRVSIVLFLLFQSFFCFSQITFTSRPVNNQLYPRNTTTNNATVNVSGTVDVSTYSRIRLEVYRNNALLATSPAQSATQNQTFSFSYDISAELADYKFVVSMENPANTWNAVYTADKVVAGDAIIVQGQSNATASQQFSGSAITASYNNSYIRVLGSASPTLDANGVNSLQWFIANGNTAEGGNGNTGQWAYVMASQMIAQTGIPVAVFNGASPNRGIAYFARNASNASDLSTNYGRLYARVQKGGFLNAIRAIFWYQGEYEADGNRSPNETQVSYKTKWNTLYNNWKTDFATPGQRFYIMQIRFGCNGQLPRTKFVNEALRQLAVEHIADTRVYGTGALKQEPLPPNANQPEPNYYYCHFTFADGYEKLGIDLSRIVLFDLYSVQLPASSLPPFVTQIAKTVSNEIVLTLQNSDPLTIAPGALGNFTFEGAASQPTITASSVVGNTITLQLDTYPSGVTGLSYNDQPNHRGTNGPDIVTSANMLSLVNFTNFPIVTAVPVKLIRFAGQEKGESIELKWDVSDEQNVAGYEVLHSTNGLSFTKVGFVKANNYAQVQQYHFIHEGQKGANNIYKLKMIDLDGKYTYSPIINIKKGYAPGEFNIAVNPNPVVNDARILIQSKKSGKADIVVINSIGQQVSLLSRNIQNGKNTVFIPGNSFGKEGLYYVKIKTADGEQTLKLFFKPE